MAPDRSHRLLCLLASAQLSPLTTFGTKLFEVTDLRVVATNCKLTVKDTGDLLLLRDWIFEELGPPYVWIIMLSVVEWDTLTDARKELHSTMRASWLSTMMMSFICSCRNKITLQQSLALRAPALGLEAP